MLTSVDSVFSQTIVSGGEVTGLWTKSESPYIISGDISIPSSGKLAIDPGVDVLFTGQFNFEVFGRLESTGTFDHRIYFGMSDTAGYSSDNYEGWLGISFTENLDNYSFLNYTDIEFSVGSGVACYSSLVKIQNSTIQHNKGYGMYLSDATDLILENTQINYNLSGGIKMYGSSPIISDFDISHNMGTGIVIIGSSISNENPQFSNGFITDNSSDNYGGGVYIGMDASVKMNSVSITGNTSLAGGGICCDMGELELHNSNISYNAAQDGGGINIDGWSNVSINSSLLTDNEASQSGGACLILNSSVSIDRSTIAYNVASEASSGIEYGMIENKVNTIKNSILWENYPKEFMTFDLIPEVSFCDVMDGYQGFKVIDEDPLFVDALNNNYHLQWNEYPQESGFKSPAIDSGDPMIDYDPDGTVADIGAFYFEQTMVTNTNEMRLDYALLVYPNPVVESFAVKSVKEIQKIQITNISGSVIQEFANVKSNDLINISNYNTGIYLLHIYIDNKLVVSKKLIKN